MTAAYHLVNRPAWVMLVWLLAVCVLVVTPAASLAADPAPPQRENPFAAHNSYPWRFYAKDRFDKALASGLKHLEVDVTFDPARQAVVATHDEKPTGNEPELGKLLEPLWQRWGAAPDDGYTLIIDLKTASPELAAGLRKILEPRQALLSTLTKGSDARFHPGKITVCLTGSTAGHRIFDEQTPAGSDYLAFSDDSGAPGNWQSETSQYVPNKPPGFVRFITLEKSNFLDAPGARGDEHVSLSRLREVAGRANELGYGLRIYTINPARAKDANSSGVTKPDGRQEPLSPGWDTHFWDLCLDAGVTMIATDAYDVAAAHWKAYMARQAAEPQTSTP